MADATYVEVSKFTVKEIFDDKHKSRVVDVTTKAATAAVKGSSKLTLDTPKEKGAKGWAVIGSVVSLGPDKAGKKFGAVVSVAVATWPGKSIKATTKGEAFFAAGPDEKIAAGDVDQVAGKATEEAMKSAVSFMASKTPE